MQSCSNQTAELKNAEDVYFVAKTDNFAVTGDGSNPNWEKATWLALPQHRPHEIDHSRATKVKVLYSQTGIYCLFDCFDKKITATMESDFMNLWTEDVVEVFFWTDEAIPAYLEYEISPLNYELAILVTTLEGTQYRWQPFHYAENRRTRKATSVRGGEKKHDAEITGWMAEFFIPYTLFYPLQNVPPKSGTQWRANFYRMDYDDIRISWSWRVMEDCFHEYFRFGTLLFE